MFYTYNQNNSGGFFHVDESVGQYVIIEADSSDQANDLAKSKAGIYFEGCDDGTDCSCCGDRWSRNYSDGTEEPMIYSKTIDEFKDDPGMVLRPEMCIHIYYQDDRHEKIVFDAVKAIEEKNAEQRAAAKKLWGNSFSIVNGARNKNPVRFFETTHVWSTDEDKSTFYDKSGNLSIKEGVVIEKDYGWISFASDNKEEVESFIAGADELMGFIRTLISEVDISVHRRTNKVPNAKDKGMESLCKLFEKKED